MTLVVTLLPARASAEIAGGQGGAGSDAIGSWVLGDGPGGGVRPPSGSSCSAWASAAGPETVANIDTVRQDANGVMWNLFYRVCDGLVQNVWVPQLTASQLGELAFDEVSKTLPKPAPVLSPDLAVGGYVNFESWLVVADPGVVSATSSIPGLSATATAQVTRLEWRPGDGSLVTCVPFGALPPSPGYTGRAPCGHTFRVPSVSSVTHSSDDRFHGSVTLVWSVAWSASDGSSGVLGEASSVTPFVYRVREIQTIGMEGQ